MKIVCITFKDEMGNAQCCDMREERHNIKEITQHNAQGEGAESRKNPSM